MSAPESFWLTSEDFDTKPGRHGIYSTGRVCWFLAQAFGIEKADLRVYGNADRTVFVTVVKSVDFFRARR